jgi:hypothetical protein
VDHAVALVQTYLQLNGFFTAAEYPVIEALQHGGYRTVTDVDILAFRFPSATRLINSDRGPAYTIGSPDPLLDVSDRFIDLLVGEVKEGRANMNSPTTDPNVLRAVLARFGCVDECEDVIGTLMSEGTAITQTGHRVRMVIFGGLPREAPPMPCKLISLGHVLKFMQEYVRRHWKMLRHIQFKDPAFSFLMTLEKARRGERRTREVPPAAAIQERRSDSHPRPPKAPPRGGSSNSR